VTLTGKAGLSHTPGKGLTTKLTPPPASPENYSDSDDEMACTKQDREAKKRAQAATAGGTAAQPACRRGQGRAEAPQDAENGEAPGINNVNAQMAEVDKRHIFTVKSPNNKGRNTVTTP